MLREGQDGEHLTDTTYLGVSEGSEPISALTATQSILVVCGGVASQPRAVCVDPKQPTAPTLKSSHPHHERENVLRF